MRNEDSRRNPPSQQISGTQFAVIVPAHSFHVQRWPLRLSELIGVEMPCVVAAACCADRDSLTLTNLSYCTSYPPPEGTDPGVQICPWQ